MVLHCTNRFSRKRRSVGVEINMISRIDPGQLKADASYMGHGLVVDVQELS